MEIIKPGNPQKGWTKEFACTGDGNGGGGCGAILRISVGDLFHTYRHCRDETDIYTTFCCIQCGVETDITCPSNISDQVRDKK